MDNLTSPPTLPEVGLEGPTSKNKQTFHFDFGPVTLNHYTLCSTLYVIILPEITKLPQNVMV